ncbi:hypothetical protein AMECASPLE_030379 [Ameca splendens]|uniref:Uncharacterized protein n=1 Tax=Ameca splendens TaxID=208324 RepID=A0ABV0Z4S2_9TELE
MNNEAACMRYSDLADYCCIVGNVVLVCAKRQRVAVACGPVLIDFQALVKGSAEHGFVVVSFGAGVKYLSHDIAHKLAGALARLPQLVIWRCERFVKEHHSIVETKEQSRPVREKVWSRVKVSNVE